MSSFGTILQGSKESRYGPHPSLLVEGGKRVRIVMLQSSYQLRPDLRHATEAIYPEVYSAPSFVLKCNMSIISAHAIEQHELIYYLTCSIRDTWGIVRTEYPQENKAACS